MMKAKLLITSVLLSIFMAGCEKAPEATNNTNPNPATEIVEQKTTPIATKNPDWPSYIATTDATNAPYELRDDLGVVVGFDVDLINAIAKEQKFNVEVIPQPWAGIFNSLNSGERHILIAPLTITPERKEQVDFTMPYIYPTRTAYLLPETAKKLGIETYQDLPKATIAAKKNTTNISSLEADFGKDKLKLEPVDSQYLALTAIISGKAQVGFGDTAVMQYHAQSHTDKNFITIEQPLKTPVEAGFAVKKGNTELVNTLNEGLKKVVASGEYKEIAIKWFGNELGEKIAVTTENHFKSAK